MNIQLYVGGELAYDNRLQEEHGYNVYSIAIDETVNKGGTAKVILPPEHPAYDSFSPFRVPVEIYRDGKLRWRGRPIPPAKEDAYRRKTIMCEGELCFLQDAIQRPYAYSGTAADVFAKVIDVYNAAVEPWKRFAVGSVTVAGNVELTSKNPQNVMETAKDLIEALGGYIFFDSAADGSRRINWYKDFPYRCNQTVRYGYNLTNPTSQTNESDFATRIIPYGAAGEDGARIQININGRDYVENAAAVAQHGVIEKAVIYNDITDPEELRTRAESDVAVSGLIPGVIQMNAIDMSRQDLSLDAFAVGQQVPAESAFHNLSGSYFLMSLSEDLVNPQVGKITLMRELASISGGPVRTLTGAIAVSRKGLLSQANNNADLSALGAVANQTQAFIFNKLTNNGALQGLYMLDGQLYVNASYMKSGVFDTSLLKTGVITSADGTVSIDLSQNKIFVTNKDTNRVIVLSSTGIVGISGGADSTNSIFALNVLSNGASLTNGVNGQEMQFYGKDCTLVGSPSCKETDVLGKKVSIVGSEAVVINPGKTQLWSGTCAVGSTCAVKNTSYYDLFAVRLGNSSGTSTTVVLAYKVGNTIRGVGGWCGTATEQKQIFFLSATFSGDTWTIVDAGVHNVPMSGGVSEGTRLQVKEVIGVI